MSLGRRTGYAGGGVDPVTQAVMAVRVKKWRQASDPGDNIWSVFLRRAVLQSNHKLEVAVVPAVRMRRIIRDMEN